MDATTSTIIAVVAIVLSAVGATWKISREIGGIETRLTEKFNALNGEVQHIKGLLEGLGLSDRLPKSPQE